MSAPPKVAISVVSHRQGNLTAALLAALAEHVRTSHELVVTLNVPEVLPFRVEDSRVPIRVLRNAAPKGFSANHNAAFRQTSGEYFCVLNPDIRITSDPFPCLLDCLLDPAVGVAAPVICNPAGAVEDSARRFPTPWRLLQKAFARRVTLDYVLGQDPIEPDWVAGMFMLFRRDVFSGVGGFDERYHLYYEDVDLCARLALSGKRMRLCPAATVVHDARRESRHDLRHAWWHLSSMLRYFSSDAAARVGETGQRTW